VAHDPVGVLAGEAARPGLTPLLSHIARDTLDGGLHCGYHALGVLLTFPAGLAEAFLLGNSAERVDMALDTPAMSFPL
jgi:hypothetical protein